MKYTEEDTRKGEEIEELRHKDNVEEIIYMVKTNMKEK